MTWVKIDDGIWSHPKMNAITNDAFSLFICGLSYAGQYLTDGMLSDADVERIAAYRQTGPGATGELVSHGLWERTGDGWRIVPDKRLFHIDAPSREPMVRRIWRKLRRKVAPLIFGRDGHACRQCKTTERLTVDHVIPVHYGGTNDEGNLQTLCVSCNSRKRDR